MAEGTLAEADGWGATVALSFTGPDVLADSGGVLTAAGGTVAETEPLLGATLTLVAGTLAAAGTLADTAGVDTVVGVLVAGSDGSVEVVWPKLLTTPATAGGQGVAGLGLVAFELVLVADGVVDEPPLLPIVAKDLACLMLVGWVAWARFDELGLLLLEALVFPFPLCDE